MQRSSSNKLGGTDRDLCKNSKDQDCNMSYRFVWNSERGPQREGHPIADKDRDIPLGFWFWMQTIRFPHVCSHHRKRAHPSKSCRMPISAKAETLQTLPRLSWIRMGRHSYAARASTHWGYEISCSSLWTFPHLLSPNWRLKKVRNFSKIEPRCWITEF